MLDRESKFSNAELIDLLKNKFVPVAFDQFYQRQQNDAEGKFYQRIASQGPRNNFIHTTQGCYVADAAGNFYGYNNNFGAEQLLGVVKEGLNQFNSKKSNLHSISKIKRDKSDPKFTRSIPGGASVVQVNAKVLYAAENELDTEHGQIFNNAISRDNLWVLPDEIEKLSHGVVAKSLIDRILRFHLVDNTRGEPEMWDASEFKTANLEVLSQNRIEGEVWLETPDGKRGYRANIKGQFEVEDNRRLTRFDMVAFGQHWGKSQWVADAAEGKTPLVVTFRLADKNDVAYTIPPQGTKGWQEPYLNGQQ